MNPFAPVEAGTGHLPPVPQGTLSGLKSFIRRTHRSRKTDTSSALTGITQGEITLVSADYNYHAQQVAGASAVNFLETLDGRSVAVPGVESIISPIFNTVPRSRRSIST